MSRLAALKAATSKPDLALVLGVKPSTLTYALYKIGPKAYYSTFDIPKKNGGLRVIDAPSGKLKLLQSKLSDLLLDCIDEINEGKPKNRTGENFKSTLSHGFTRKKSIITNAEMHLKKKNVLNIDLEDFFGQFNFGRVRGFFIRNRHFQLHDIIATVIAQIACNNNRLPQGSPCSPVIANLITHPLDIRLAKLARKCSCVYSRYADDLTFSTREAIFPKEIMAEVAGDYVPGTKFLKEITRAGFSINPDKTRIQYRTSRQDVTGVVVNYKANTKSEYWRTVRAQCHSLFKTGAFTMEEAGAIVNGRINVLQGRLNFIDQLDRSNRLREKPPLNPSYQHKNHGLNTLPMLNSRERVYSDFLYYKYFYGNDRPTILCEGKTDNVYLKCAIHMLSARYPLLANSKTATSDYELLVQILRYSKTTRFLLQLYGGTSYLKYFVENFEKRSEKYGGAAPSNPVIVVLDNDSGPDKLLKSIEAKAKAFPATAASLRDAEFIHVTRNLYVVLTPKISGKPSEMEDFFTDVDKNVVLGGKSFNYKKGADSSIYYGKEIFARKVVEAKKKSIDFNGFNDILSRVSSAIHHFKS